MYAILNSPPQNSWEGSRPLALTYWRHQYLPSFSSAAAAEKSPLNSGSEFFRDQDGEIVKHHNFAWQKFSFPGTETPKFTCACCASDIEEVVDNMPISIFIEKLSGVNQCCNMEPKPVEQGQEILLLFFPLCFVHCFALSITKCSRAL